MEVHFSQGKTLICGIQNREEEREILSFIRMHSHYSPNVILHENSERIISLQGDRRREIISLLSDMNIVL